MVGTWYSVKYGTVFKNQEKIIKLLTFNFYNSSSQKLNTNI